MLQNAWHIVNSTDPLADSDDESENKDEHMLRDYSYRVDVLSNLLRRFDPRHASHSPVAMRSNDEY